MDTPLPGLKNLVGASFMGNSFSQRTGGKSLLAAAVLGALVAGSSLAAQPPRRAAPAAQPPAQPDFSAVQVRSKHVKGNIWVLQGAGGNVSWKDADILWVKASGTWLADAAEKDIFVPVDLPSLHKAIAARNFEVKPSVCSDSPLRPSIETLLHALMPHTVVVHVHAVEVLAHLVRRGFSHTLGAPPDSTIRWACVGYHKPGAALAIGIADALAATPGANVIFLQNHGVVIGADSVAEVDTILQTLVAAFRVEPRRPNGAQVPSTAIETGPDQTWRPVADPLVHQLATDPVLFERLQSAWALYPDHVVFLGPSPLAVNDKDEFASRLRTTVPSPGVVFVRNVGVFADPTLNAGKQAQIRCYYDVLARQATDTPLSPLTESDIGELLNWDAERYRIQIAK